MRFLSTFLIILATCGIGAVVFILQSEEHRHLLISEKITYTGKKAFDFDPEAVRKVIVTTPDGLTGEFIFENNQWTTIQPWQDRADNLAPLISFALATEVNKTISTEDAAPESFGFGEHSHRIQFFDIEDNKLVDFDLGLPSAWHVNIKDSEKQFPCLYVRNRLAEKDAPTLLCTDPQFQTLELFKNNLVRFRNYWLTNPFEAPFLKKISIAQKGSTISLEREVSHATATYAAWGIKKPLEERADPVAVKHLLQTLTYIAADELQSSAGVTLPDQDEDKIVITLNYFRKEQPIILTIYPSTTKNNITLATVSDRPNVIFQIPSQARQAQELTYQNFPANVNNIRARNLLTLNPQDINLISVRKKGKAPIRLAKKLHWNLVTGTNEAVPANKQALTDFIAAMDSNSIVSFVSDAPSDLSEYGLDQPQQSVYMVDQYNNPQVIHFGNAENYMSKDQQVTGFYAKCGSRDSVWLVESNVLTSIKTEEWAWRPLGITNLSIPSIRNISRKRHNAPAQYIDFDFGADRLKVFEGAKENWDENEEITHKVDGTRVGFFIRTLSDLTALNRIDPNSIEVQRTIQDQFFMSISVTYEDYNTGMPKKIQLDFAPVGKLSNSRFFYVRNAVTGEIFNINKETCKHLFDSIRYKR